MNIEIKNNEEPEVMVSIPISEWLRLTRESTYYRAIKSATVSIYTNEPLFAENKIAEIVRAVIKEGKEE